MELSTIPKSIYKESDRLWPLEEGEQPDTYDTESWSFYIVAKLTQCRKPVHPLGATIDLISNDKVMKSFTADGKYLAQFTVPEENVAAPPHIVYLLIWNHFIEPTALDIDRLRYALSVQDAQGTRSENTLEIPVRRYVQKAKLIFPVAGKCIVVVGHAYNEHHRLDQSQFAYDIFPLGPHGELIRADGSSNEEWWSYGAAVLAPADGTVVYVRDDIPDNDRPGLLPDDTFYKTILDAFNATAGNHMIIDHGQGEYSLLAHLKPGSVAVAKGQHVTQGQSIGRVGNSGKSGAPHLHYALRNNPEFHCDGLPSRFENLQLLGLKGQVTSPKRGLFLIAQ